MMKHISDTDLILFHYDDGLDAALRERIADALQHDRGVARRYAALQATLSSADLDPPPAAPAQLADRVWMRLAPRIGASVRARSPRPARGVTRRHRWLAGALAASVLLTVSFFAGRVSAPDPSGRDRIFNAYLVEHLDASQRALLTAVNSSGDTLVRGNAVLAQSLIANNRLYLAAATRHGDVRLAELLRQLEPVLIELANPGDGDDIQSRKGLGEFVERSDLLFQVRATEASLRARTLTNT